MLLRRIAYVVKCFPMLTQTFIVGELSELLRRGIDLRIVSMQTPVEPQRHEIIAQLGLDRLAIYDSANFYGKLAQFDPQLLHAHFATDPAAAARELADRLNVPFTFTAHGYDIYYRPPPDFSARAAAAAAVVTVSRAGARHIEKNFKLPIERIHVIPNGVDTRIFRPADPALRATDKLPQGRHQPIILCVARHAPVKSLDLLIDAGGILRDRKVHFLCILIGDGESRRGLEAKVARMGLHHCFEFMGTMIQREVLAWWRRASIGVLSSESEGMPVSLIEAAACAVPVVATRVGGVEELWKMESVGFWCRRPTRWVSPMPSSGCSRIPSWRPEWDRQRVKSRSESSL